ncbi:MAG: hypothetical protein GKR86_06820 [Ilumatobacter sp.]|nr:hypothetical protein [Ilumatobacter sp.]
MEAVFVMATSTVILRSRALPRWLAIAGYSLGVIMFLAPFVSEAVGFGFPIWVLLVSIVLLLTASVELDDKHPRPATPSDTTP